MAVILWFLRRFSLSGLKRAIHLSRFLFSNTFDSSKTFRGFLFLMVCFFPAVVWSQSLTATPVLTPIATPDSNEKTLSSDDLTLSPQEELQVLYAIDAQSNTANSAAASSTASTVYSLPPIPTGLKVIVLKEGVYLSWEPAPAGSTASTYNVYRSTVPGMGYHLINLKPINAAYYLDSPQNSLEPPHNGEDYFYVVTSVDNHGNVSPYSDEIPATPLGMDVAQSTEEVAAAKLAKESPPEEEKVLKIPEQNVINLQLPAESQLSIQGYKKIDAQFAFQKFNRPDANGIPSEVDTTTVNQELVVNLKGKVGKNVDVNVDYSDVNRAGGIDQSKQDISIVYHGDPDSAVQEVAFGDLQLTLPNTEFAGFSKQLFGLEAVLKFDRFRFTSFFAQTKGIAVTKVFTGNTTQIDKIIQDITFIPLKYFLITRAGLSIGPTSLPKPNSEQIWVNAANGQINPVGVNFIGAWEHWLPGRDYTVDYSTGTITFLRGLSITAQIAVGFTDMNGNQVGLNAQSNLGSILSVGNSINLKIPDDGIVDNSHFLIKDNNTGSSSAGAVALSPLYLVNYFSLGTDKIVPPQQDPNFLFQVISQGTNNIVQTGQGGSGSAPYVYNVNLDLNLMSVTNVNFNTAPTAPPIYFPERPFANLDGTASQPAGTGTNDVYSQTTPPTSEYNIHIRYKTQLNFFKLDNIGILRGSETVYLDGRLLRRDADYFIDYTSGFLDFQDKSILGPNSQVVVTYEYSPFGGFAQNNILGARAEYDVTDHFFIGSTFLMSTSQNPTDTPQIGSTPNSLTLFDADAKYDMDQDEVHSLTGIIPGLENWKPPINIKLSGEVAQSYFDPDTYNAEGETGVAMVDNMEGIDSVVGASLSSTSWLVSSAPLPVPALGNINYNAGPDPVSNNRVRFYDDQVLPNVDFAVNTSTAIPGGGGHVYATTGQATDIVNVLQFPYSHLTSERWAGLRQVISTNGTDFSSVQYFQSWIYNDGNDKWIMFDFGVIDEDSNGNGAFDADPSYFSQGTGLTPNPNYGIPTFYMPNTPGGVGGVFPSNFTNDDANPPHSGFIGYPGEISQEGQLYAGAGVSFVTENMDGTGNLNHTNAYYEYGVRANWTGWHLVKIPVNLASPDIQTATPDGTSYFFHTSAGGANPQIIRTLRLWATGVNSTPISGVFLTDSIGFAHNLWQLQVDPTANAQLGVTVNTSKFDVNSISQAQNSNYQPTLRFITIQPGQDQTAVEFNEKSLQVVYNVSNADLNPPGNPAGSPIYYATRQFPQGLDFTDFQELRMDLQIRSYTPGEVLFVRLGNDQLDYYQYNLQLSSLASNCLDSWGTVVIPMDGSGGNRIKVGTPFVNRATQISIGVISSNSPSGRTGELWVNNLRTDSPNVRSGVARRLNAEFDLGEDPKKPFATINARYREVDSGFTEMDQTSTHFQHSVQIGADYSSSGVKLFSQPLVTQISITRQDLYTEAALTDNPYYIDLPNTRTDNATGSISYTKDLGANYGRLTSVRLSGSANYETDVYQPDYLDEAGVQGNTQKYEGIISLASTYDAPIKLFAFPVGTNQLTQTYSITHDTQQFDFDTLAPYDRTTRVQTYGWTNTSELVKNLVFTPGYTLSLTDAVGNTNSPGIPGVVDGYTPFLQRYQPKAGLVYRGIPGMIPSVDYSGSSQYDYVSYPDGTRFNNANNVNYSLNLTPGTWIPLFQKMNLTLFGGHTESATASIPNYGSVQQLSFAQQWWTDPDYSAALNATKSVANQLNASFKLFDVWDFRPTGSWTNQQTLLSQGTNPVEQDSDTLGLTTIYSKKILTLPFIDFNFNSVQLQYTHTDNTQYDSGTTSTIDSLTTSDLYAITLPYDINKKAQGNIRFQATLGSQNGLATSNVLTTQKDYQASAEYDQKFAPNLEIHVPFTHWKIKLQDAIEFKANFITEFVDNESLYALNELQTERVRGTIELDYNALKNLRVGLGAVNEYFWNNLNSQLNYVLWQVNISAEARF